MSSFIGSLITIIKEARQEARQRALEEFELRWKAKTLPTLHLVDKTFAGIARELMENHCPGGTFDSFNESWETLKRLIRIIQLGINHEEKND